MKSRTRSELSVQLCTGTFPFTVVTATSSSSGCSAANMIATASSVPVSTSRISLRGIALVHHTRIARAGGRLDRGEAADRGAQPDLLHAEHRGSPGEQGDGGGSKE